MIELQITSITAPTYCVNGRVDINEYELRNMMVDVAKGKIPFEDITSIISNQSGEELGMRRDGFLDGDCDSLSLNTKFTMELLKQQH